jgi:homocysteine S-methyltransferase
VIALDSIYITDGGMETELIFEQGFELPEFASFPLLDDLAGREALHAYYQPYVEIARRYGVGIILDAPTWRASRDWGEKLGYSPEALEEVNRRGVALIRGLKREAGGNPEVVVSGCVGPRGDAYRVGDAMSAEEAERYHTVQIETLAAAGAEVISGLTLTNSEEAIGIARAATSAGMPVVISFTVETDGRLPSRQSIGEAIERVDAETGGAAEYFMLNCAHPTHFAGELQPAPWLERLRGLRANASSKSHEELDESDELDPGDPEALAADYRELRERVPSLAVFGGCCGTGHRHIEAICAAVTR